MKSPDDVAQWVKQRFLRQRWTWLDGGGSWPLQVNLELPTQKAAIANFEAVRKWSDAWRAWREERAASPRETQPELVSTTVAWRNIGTQSLPSSLSFPSAECIADYSGEGKDWRRTSMRRAVMLERWPTLKTSGFGSNYSDLGAYRDDDFERLLAVLEWFVANPKSGIYLRQLPVPNVDTKWIDLKRRGVVADLFRRITRSQTDASLPAESLSTQAFEVPSAEGETPGAQESSLEEASSNFYDICGLRHPPVKLRILILCPNLRARMGGLRDVEATIEDWAQLDIQPRQLLVVENKDTCLAMPDVEGVVAVIKLGNSVSLVTRIPWLERVPVLYWGDIDTHGYSILVLARKRLHDVRSVLMGEHTVVTHLDRLVREDVQAKNVDKSMLSEGELKVYESLLAHRWGASMRLEQERLEWPSSLAAVLSALHQRESQSS